MLHFFFFFFFFFSFSFSFSLFLFPDRATSEDDHLALLESAGLDAHLEILVLYMRDHPYFHFSEQGMAKLMTLLVPELTSHTGGKTMDARTFLVLRAFSRILPISLSMAGYMETVGAGFVKDNFHLDAYFLGGWSTASVAIEAVRMLAENVVGFSKWEDYVATTPENHRSISKALLPFSSFSVRTYKLTSSDIEGRHLILQSRDLIAQAKRNVAGRQPSSSFQTAQTAIRQSSTDSSAIAAAAIAAAATAKGTATAALPASSVSLAVVKESLPASEDAPPEEQEETEQEEKEQEEKEQEEKEEEVHIPEGFGAVAADELVNQAIGDALSSVKTGNEAFQQELLNSAEILAVNSLKGCRKKMIINSKGDDYDRAKKTFDEAQANLILIHEARNFKNRANLLEKRAKLELSLSSNPEAANYYAQKQIQDEALRCLKELYAVFVKATAYLDASEQLLGLNSQISSVYTTSISVVVAGLIKVGKSTVVNCALGQNLSPHRDDAMTSFPTRYVHHPSMDEPLMIVPFDEQINEVLRLIREKAATPTSFAELKKVIKRSSLVTLLNKIVDENLVIQRQYRGSKDIINASLDLNDIFRLAAHSHFGNQLIDELPLSWNHSQDEYLTVYVKFPDVGLELGLVEFSIVDTPGINEDNVKKLSLHKVLNDSLDLCQYAALVTTPLGYNSESMAPLKEMFHHAAKHHKVPVMSIVTRAEEVKERKWRETIFNISSNLNVDPEDPQFKQTNTFLVSARMKSLSQRMTNFLNAKSRKPQINPDDTEETELKRDWVFLAVLGENQEESYQESDLAALFSRCERLSKASKMDRPINHLLTSLAKKAVLIAVGPALIRAREKAEGFQAFLSAGITAERALAAQAEASRLVAELDGHRNKLKEALELEATKKKKDFAGQIKVISATVSQHVNKPFPEETNSFNSFLDYLIFALQSLKKDDPETFSLGTSSSEIVYGSPEEAQSSLQELGNCIGRAMADWLPLSNRAVPKGLNAIAQTYLTKIEISLAKIRAVYQHDLKVSIPETKDFSLKGKKVPEGNMLDIGGAIKQIERPKKRAGTVRGTISGLKNLLKITSTTKGTQTVVDPASARAQLVQFTDELGKQWIDILSKKTDELVATTVSRVAQDLDGVISRITGAAESMFVVQGDEGQLSTGKIQIARDISTKLAALASLERSLQVLACKNRVREAQDDVTFAEADLALAEKQSAKDPNDNDWKTSLELAQGLLVTAKKSLDSSLEDLKIAEAQTL